MRLIYASLVCLLLSGCFGQNSGSDNSFAFTETESESETDDAPVIDYIQILAAEIVSSLSDSLLAAQMLICGIDGAGSLPAHIKTLLAECPTGGVMLFRYNLDSDNEAIRNLIGETVSLIKDKSGISPFIAVDHEGGSVNRFRYGVASLPAAASYWELFLSHGRRQALDKIEADSLKAGREISGLGINLNFAPVAEYLNDYNRDFLSSRSYGTEPSFTGDASLAFIQSMEQAGVLCVIKHFPGSAGPDPHYSASLLDLEKDALSELIFPFTFLFNNGARAVMVAHTAVPALDDKIASLSPVVMQNWLRGELGFGGIIISDDFSMAAARKQAAGSLSPEEAAIQSIAAGADMILVWQNDLLRTHRAILSALEDGQLSRERLADAAMRIIYEKIRMKLIDVE